MIFHHFILLSFLKVAYVSFDSKHPGFVTILCKIIGEVLSVVYPNAPIGQPAEEIKPILEKLDSSAKEALALALKSDKKPQELKHANLGVSCYLEVVKVAVDKWTERGWGELPLLDGNMETMLNVLGELLKEILELEPKELLDVSLRV